MPHFTAKCTKLDFGSSAPPPDPAGELDSTPPDSLAGFWGPTHTLKGKGGRRGEARGGRGEKGVRGKGTGKPLPKGNPGYSPVITGSL